MENITVRIDVSQSFDVDVYPSDIISALNNLKTKVKWNCISIMLKDLNADLNDLNEEQKDIIKSFLETKLELFSKPNSDEKSLLH